MTNLTTMVDDLLGRPKMTSVQIVMKGIEDGTQTSTTMMSLWWTQIAERFANYTQRLLFNLQLEPQITDFPNGVADINALNLALVNAVRASNPNRYLIIYHGGISDEGPGNTGICVFVCVCVCVCVYYEKKKKKCKNREKMKRKRNRKKKKN